MFMHWSPRRWENLHALVFGILSAATFYCSTRTMVLIVADPVAAFVVMLGMTAWALEAAWNLSLFIARMPLNPPPPGDDLIGVS